MRLITSFLLERCLPLAQPPLLTGLALVWWFIRNLILLVPKFIAPGRDEWQSDQRLRGKVQYTTRLISLRGMVGAHPCGRPGTSMLKNPPPLYLFSLAASPSCWYTSSIERVLRILIFTSSTVSIFTHRRVKEPGLWMPNIPRFLYNCFLTCSSWTVTTS